jgi:hypothetical protein
LDREAERFRQPHQANFSLGGIKDDFAFSAEPTNDGGFIVAGSSKSADGMVTSHHGPRPNQITGL